MTSSNPPDFAQAWQQSIEEWTRAWTGIVQPTQEGERPPPTPTEAWKRSSDRWLTAWSNFLEESMSRPDFAASAGQTLNRMLDVQKPIRDQREATMQRWLEAMNMPSRADLVRLSRQLNDVNARLDELGDQIEELQDALADLDTGNGAEQPRKSRNGRAKSGAGRRS